jgi:hypothetical protein
MKYLSKCPCQTHLSTQLIDRTYSISVERLFEYIFGGDTEFLAAYHTSRRIKGFEFFLCRLRKKNICLNRFSFK